MIFLNLIKQNNAMWIEIRQFDNFLKEASKTNPWNQKSLKLDQDSRRNHQMNRREISQK